MPEHTGNDIMGKNKEPEKDQDKEPINEAIYASPQAFSYTAQCLKCTSVYGFVAQTDLAIGSYFPVKCKLCGNADLYIQTKVIVDILN